MARKPRVEFEGALYHVIVRGNHRRDIFRDENDRVAYLKRVEHYRERYRFILYAYVLMSIETGAVGLSKIIQGIQFRNGISDQSRSCSVGSTLSQ